MTDSTPAKVISALDSVWGESEGLGAVGLSPDDRHYKQGVRTKDEAFDDLRRENFRLRLACYKYEQMFPNNHNPQDAESSRIYAAESENVALRESLANDQILLNVASEMIDALKEEISRYNEEVEKLKEKMNKSERSWQSKYDDLLGEYQKVQEEIRTQNLMSLSKESEFSKRRSELESCISRLQTELAKSEVSNDHYQKELQRFQNEADKLRTTLQHVNDDELSTEKQLSLEYLSTDVHKSCQERLGAVLNIVAVLRNQLLNAGFEPQDKTDLSNYQIVHSNSSHVEQKKKHVSEQTMDFPTDNASKDREHILSDRLDSARQLIFDLGNKKLEQDKVIAELQSNERSLQSMRDKYAAAKSRLEQENQYYQDELTRTNEEIKRLSCQVKELVDRLESSLTVSESLQSESDQVKEQYSRVQVQNTNLQDQLAKLSEEKQRLTRYIQKLFVCTSKLVDVTPISLRNEGALENVAVLLNQSLRTNLRKIGADKGCLSGTMNDSTLQQSVDTAYEDGGSMRHQKPNVTIYSPVTELSSQRSPSITTNERLESLALDNITSVDATTNMVVTSPPLSYLGSIVESPTISTHNHNSPIFPEPLNEITEQISPDHPPSDEQKNTNITPVNTYANSREYGQVVYNNSVQCRSETRVTPTTELTEGDHKRRQSLPSLRNLYDLIHDLVIQLDNVRFSQHTFVEMINRSLSTAGIDVSLQLSPARGTTSLFVESDKAPGVHLSFWNSVNDNNHADSIRNVSTSISRADATCGCVETLDNLDASITGLNQTVAELRDGCPLSPVSLKNRHQKVKVDGELPSHFDKYNHSIRRKHASDQSNKEVHEVSAGNLVGSLTFCVESNNDSLNLTETKRRLNSSEPLCDRGLINEQNRPNNMGDLTMVEWEHKDIFERLSLAMSKLRDAIQECTDVGSSFLDVGVQEQLNVLLNSQPGLQQTAASFDKQETNDTTPKANEVSIRFDGVTPQLGAVANQTEEVSLSQLYGSAWRCPRELSLLGHSFQDESYLKLKQDYENLLQRHAELTRQFCTFPSVVSNNASGCKSTPNHPDVKTDLLADNELCRYDNMLLQHVDGNLIDSVSKECPFVAVPNTEQTFLVDKAEMKCTHGTNIPQNVVSQPVEDELKNDCMNCEKLIRLYGAERADIVDIFKRFDSTMETKKISDAITEIMTELVGNREALLDLKTYCSELEQRLSESISSHDYHILEVEFTKLQHDVNEAHQQIEYHRNELSYAVNNLRSLLDVDDSASLKTLIESISNKLGDQKEQINLICTERQSIMESVSRVICQSDIPDTLYECFQLITSDIVAYRELNNNFLNDRHEALNLLSRISPLSNDEHSMVDHITAVINLFNDNQQEIEYLKQTCNESEKSLLHALERCEHLEETLTEVNNQLTASRSNVQALEAAISDVANTHVPSETYNALHERFYNTEKYLYEVKSTLAHYESDETSIKEVLIQVSDISNSLSLPEQVTKLYSMFVEAHRELSSSNINLEQMQLDYDELSNQHTRQSTELENLRALIVSKDDTVRANQEFHRQLVARLDNLQKTHGSCIEKHQLVDADTSTEKIDQRDAQIVNISAAVSANTTDLNAPRVRKYNELRAAAFEIKEKLVNRTDKLQHALEEVARLRSVIQQDKERANVTLKEVEDLREQVILKNKKIRDLEVEIKRLRIPLSKASTNTRNTNSSTRTLSELEQPRGFCPHDGLMGSTTNIYQTVGCSTTVSLLRFPSTPTISMGPFEPSTHDNTPQSLVNRDTPVRNDTQSVHNGIYGRCRRCCTLEKSLSKFQGIVNGLRKYMDLSILDESSLRLTEQSRVGSNSSSTTSSDSHCPVTPSHIPNQIEYCTVDLVDLRANIESLNEARRKFRQYADKMNTLCAVIVQQCNKSSTCLKCAHFDFGTLMELIKSIIGRWESFIMQYDLSDCESVQVILADLYTVLSMVPDSQMARAGSVVLDKENIPHPTEATKAASLPNRKQLVNKVDHYRRKYEHLAFELGEVTKEFTQTTDMLSATRLALKNSCPRNSNTNQSN